MFKFIYVPLFLILFNNAFAQSAKEDIVEMETEGSYVMGVEESKKKAEALALFEAKKIAVYMASKYLSIRSLLEVFELERDEIYSLVASEIQAEIIKEKWEPASKNLKCHVRIRAVVRGSDFISAEMLNKKLEEQDLEEPFRDEMEQNIPKDIDPGKDIARAYRLIRRGEWRMAIIYLDHLERKYPNWSDVFLAKAIIYYDTDEPQKMRRALEKSCGLGNDRACEDLKGLKKVHGTKLIP